MSITYSECVAVALVTQHAMRMRCIVLSSVAYPAVPYFSTLYHKRHDFRRKKSYWTQKCVFWSALQLLSATFLILRRNERDIIKTCTGLHVKCPLFLSDFYETWIFWRDFRKIPKYQISWKSIQWEPSCSMRTDRRTDIKKLIVAFRNFAKCA